MESFDRVKNISSMSIFHIVCHIVHVSNYSFYSGYSSNLVFTFFCFFSAKYLCMWSSSLNIHSYHSSLNSKFINSSWTIDWLLHLRYFSGFKFFQIFLWIFTKCKHFSSWFSSVTSNSYWRQSYLHIKVIKVREVDNQLQTSTLYSELLLFVDFKNVLFLFFMSFGTLYFCNAFKCTVYM